MLKEATLIAKFKNNLPKTSSIIFNNGKYTGEQVNGYKEGRGIL